MAAPSVNEAPPADTLQVSATIALFFTPSLSLSLSLCLSLSLSLFLFPALLLTYDISHALLAGLGEAT